MKIKYKMPLFLLPLIIIPVIIVSMIFINNTSKDAILLRSELMRTNLDIISAKIYEEHSILELVGMDETEYYLESIKTRIIKYLSRIESFDAFVHIYDFEGITIYSSSDSEDLNFFFELEKKSQIVDEMILIEFESAENGNKYIGHFFDFNPWGWRIAILSEEKLMLSAISNSMEQSILAIIAIAVVIVGVFYVLTKHLTKPLKTLTEASRFIGLGDFDRRFQINTNDEFQELAESYNQMAEQLGSYFKSLESIKLELEKNNTALKEEIAKKEKTQKKLQESEEKFRIIFNNTFHIIGLLDSEGCLIEVNETAVKVTKTRYENFVGKFFWETPLIESSDEIKISMKKAVERACSGVFVRELVELENDLGVKTYYDYSITPFLDKNGKVSLLIPEGRDITELINKENELTKLNYELEQRVNVRTAELQKTNQDLVVSLQETEHARLELFDTKDELEQSLESLRLTQDKLVESKKMAALASLVVGISHKINTPVGVCLTSASYLEANMKELKKCFENHSLTQTLFDHHIRKSLESIGLVLDSLFNVSNLVNDFKKIAVNQKIGEKKIFNLYNYFKNTIPKNIKLAESNHIVNFDFPQDIMMNGYPQVLSQIMNNLIDNSITHGFEEIDVGTIDIFVKEKGEKVIIEYSDKGIGMKSQDVDKMFEPFYTTKLGKGQSGLGMNITYNLVTSVMQGTISAESALGEGMSVTVVVPNNLSDSNDYMKYL